MSRAFHPPRRRAGARCVELDVASAQAKISQMKYIDWDAEMVHPVDGELVHAKARSLSVTDLGQVKYIFSDKTGTLTRNEMKLRRVVVRGKCYGLCENHDEDCAADYGEKSDPLTCKGSRLTTSGKTDSEAWCALKMLESFMLCNAVIVGSPRRMMTGCTTRRSPDEGALVEGGKMCGYTLSARTQKVGGERRTAPFTHSHDEI